MATSLNGILLVFCTACSLLSGVRVGRALRATEVEVFALVAVVGALAQVVAVLQFSGFVLHSFSPLILAGLHAAATLAVFRATRGTPTFGATATSERDWFASAAFVVTALAAAAFAGLRLAQAAVLPVHGFDSLHYHLAGVASWLQAGTFVRVPFATYVGRFPANADLLSLHALAFLPMDRLVGPLGLVFLAVLGIAVAALARTIGAGAWWSRWAGAAAMLIPVALAQATSGYVDLATAGFACALAAMTAVCVRSRDHATEWSFIVAGLAAGLLAGSKTTGLAPALFAALAIASTLRRARGWRHAVCFVLAAVAVGSCWYVRNWVVDRNPLSPYAVTVGGVRLFDGLEPAGDITDAPPGLQGAKPLALVRSATFDAQLVVAPRAVYPDDKYFGLGPFWPLVGIPSLLIIVVRGRRFLSLASLSALGVVAVAGLVHPYWWWPRFTLPLAAAGIAASALVGTHVLISRWIKAGAMGLALAGGVLGATKTAYPEGWESQPPAVWRRALAEGPLLRYEQLIPHLAWLSRLSPESMISIDEELHNTGYPLFPLFGRDLSRRLISVSSGTLESQLRDPRIAAFVVNPGSGLEAVLSDPASGVVPVEPQFSTGHVYVRRR